ncbi:hypothetical protein OG696_14305 [Streptomyces sp. NBC_00656]|uniref:hypothetical protein n=1 Tax=Streptomyces sp. NBC_00656 TaxID=2903668 RepID=UPI00324DA443
MSAELNAHFDYEEKEIVPLLADIPWPPAPPTGTEGGTDAGTEGDAAAGTEGGADGRYGRGPGRRHGEVT